jgi:hypothetical protein
MVQTKAKLVREERWWLGIAISVEVSVNKLTVVMNWTSSCGDNFDLLRQ